VIPVAGGIHPDHRRQRGQDTDLEPVQWSTGQNDTDRIRPGWIVGERGKVVVHDGPHFPRSLKAQVEHPTSPDVFPARLAMGHDLVVVTPRIEEGVPEDRHVPPPPFVVDGPGQTDHEPVVPGQDVGVDGHGTEGKGAEDVTE
jgi:hypothetical protein